MIVGVDLGTRRAALACIDAGFVWSASLERVVDRKAFPSEITAGCQLGDLAGDALWDALVKEDVRFYYERPIVFKNINTSVGQALSAGAFFAQLHGTFTQIYPSAVWKKEVIGSGNASKDDIRVWVEQQHPTLAQACQGIEDRFDAVAICEFGRRMADLG